MRRLLILPLLFIAVSLSSFAQDETPARLLFDGTESGNTCNLTEGLLTLDGLPNCNITSYSITLPTKEIIAGMSNPLSPEHLDKIRNLASGSTYTIAINAGCPGPSRRQLTSEFVAP